MKTSLYKKRSSEEVKVNDQDLPTVRIILHRNSKILFFYYLLSTAFV